MLILGQQASFLDVRILCITALALNFGYLNTTPLLLYLLTCSLNVDITAIASAQSINLFFQVAFGRVQSDVSTTFFAALTLNFGYLNTTPLLLYLLTCSLNVDITAIASAQSINLFFQVAFGRVQSDVGTTFFCHV